MGARESIYQKSGVRNFYKMSPHHHEAVKEIWETIEKNPTTFANGFFIRLFKYKCSPPKNVVSNDTNFNHL